MLTTEGWFLAHDHCRSLSIARELTRNVKESITPVLFSEWTTSLAIIQNENMIQSGKDMVYKLQVKRKTLSKWNDHKQPYKPKLDDDRCLSNMDQSQFAYELFTYENIKLKHCNCHKFSYITSKVFSVRMKT